MDRIDAHQHFWRYRPDEYGWMAAEGLEPIRRDFLPVDLEPELRAAEVTGSVPVQASQTLEETGWLLDLAAQHAFLRGVVGWAPLADARAADVLEQLAGRAKLKGLRHILQDEPDDYYMLRPEFNAGVGHLERFGLAYDILIFERHLPQAIQFVDRHPNQVFVLDHAAKPRIRERMLSPWRENIRELARRENVYCKLSGMATEADWKSWRESDLRPYFDTLLEAFEPRRLMFGSDWPVLLLAGSYRAWHEAASAMIAPLSAFERSRIMGGTAIEAYRLDG